MLYKKKPHVHVILFMYIHVMLNVKLQRTSLGVVFVNFYKVCIKVVILLCSYF